MIWISDRQLKHFRRMVKLVASIPPGESLEVDRQELGEIPCLEHNGALFTPPDRILENIVGSAYEFSYWEDPVKRTVTFRRLATPVPIDAELTYVSPDRRR